MPKESVGDHGNEFVVHVRWGAPEADREGGVRVGLETASTRSLFWQLLDGDLAGLGEKVRTIAEGVPTGDREVTVLRAGDEARGRALLDTLDGVGYQENDHVFTGLGVYAHLDRRDLNRLIAVLRRARDSAYGRDE